MIRPLLAVLLFLGLTAGGGAAPSQTKPEVPVALQAKVSFSIPAGPFLTALEQIERELGVPFAVLPEMFPADLKVAALSFQGPLAEGLDRLIRPLSLKWELGELGGIAVFPPEFKSPDFPDWVSKHFEVTGVELLDVEERGQNLGLRQGDVIEALNGEKINGYSAYREMVVKDVKPEDSVNLTVRRGAEQLGIKVKPDPRAPIGSIGVTRFADAPTETTIYEKGGHRDPAWNDLFARVFTEYRQKDDAAWTPDSILRAVRECTKAGCRDPQLPLMLIRHVLEFTEERWKDVDACCDAAVLRTAYGGSRSFARADAAGEFLIHGSPAVRARVRRLVECGWAATRDVRLGYSLAALHFAEADYPACLRLLEGLRKPMLTSSQLDGPPCLQLESQALQRLGKLEEARRRTTELSEKIAQPYVQIPARFQSNTFDLLKNVQEKSRSDKLPGPVGVLTWKAHSALDAINQAWGAWSGYSSKDTGPARYSPDLIDVMPPDSVEAYFFPKLVKTYSSGGYGGTVCFAFGAAQGQTLDDPIGQWRWTQSSVYRLTGSLDLTRTFGSLGYAGDIPLIGFGNGRTDELRFFKTPELVTLRCNGAWVTTDCAPCLGDEGWLAMAVTTAKGSFDAGVLVPTKRAYDVDRIRELMEKITDARVGREDKVKAWDEAAVLAPNSVMRRVMKLIPQAAREKVPAPKLPDDAPPLDEMTVANATERLEARGKAAWTAPDAEDADRVWCARGDGRLESISRARFFTTYYPALRSEGVAPEVGKPFFQKEAVWFPTKRGLFRYDRVGDVFRNIPVGGLYSDRAIESIGLKDGALTVLAGGEWALNLKTERWTSE